MRELPRDLVTILHTEAQNQRTPPIDYVIAEDGGRMAHRPEPDIAMAELLEEAAASLASERAAHAAKDAEIARLTAEKDAAEFAARNSKSLDGDALHAVRALLDSAGVPKAAFIDDHVGNAIAQRDAERAAHAQTTRERDELKADIDSYAEASSNLATELYKTEARLAEALKALEAARAIIQEDRDEMFASVTVAGDASTIDEIDRPAVDRLDAVLVEINAARRAREGGNADG